MFKAEHMGLSPSKESGQKGNLSSHKRSMSEQMHEFGTENVHSETLAQTHRLGSGGAQIEPGEISASVSRPVIHENWQPSSEDVARSSVTEHLGPPSVDTNQYGHTSKSSCPHQPVSGKMLEFGAECECTGPSELKQQLGFEILQNEPGERTTTVFGLVNENLQPFSKGVIKSSFAEHVEPQPQDVSKSGPTEKVSCPQVNALEQTVEFGPQSMTGEHGVECAHMGPSEPKHHLESEILQNEPGGPSAEVSSCFVDKNFQPLSDDVTKNSLSEHLRPPFEDVNKTSQSGKGSCPKQTVSEKTFELGFESAGCKPSEVEHKFCSELLQNEPTETSTVVSGCTAIEQFGSPPELANRSSLAEPIALSSEVVLNIPSTGRSPPEGMAKNSSLEQLETLAKKPLKNSTSLGRKDKRTLKSLKKKYMLRSLIGSNRVLRSRSQEKHKEPESSNNLAGVSTEPSGGEKRRKKKKKKKARMERKGDEYSRIRKHLRYLLNRINYEQSLISAYSAEGWKGLSLEKLKPEKELQRATSEIFRRKLKIRDLFQHLDSLCAQGGLPESLFDSEGEISSEDIFCAKCGSEDLSADNDIILCDGACDRGFHQCCLEPPLLKEDIPPDDEGWLCPGCDCKVDCIDLLNDSQGTNLSIDDNWEKVFPEAAAAAAAAEHNQDPNFGLPSDDSDDNDYDPDGPETNEKDQQDESSSDESDFTSASDELEAPPNNDQYMGLPSDDSEDENYNPNAPDLDEEVKQESSSSDFTSDSEDLGAALGENGPSLKDAVPLSVSLPGDSNGRRSKLRGSKKQSINDELSSLLESDPCQDGSAAASVKRSIERLDYKKLYDEAYENVSSSSGDDEDWTDAASPRQKRKSTDEVAPVSSNGNAIVVENGRSTKGLKQKTKDTDHTPKRKTRQTSKFEAQNTASVESHEGSSGKRTMSSPYRRLGESVTQRLYKSFKENQYPDRSTKEGLARELEITFRQVNKWFENARWSFNHSSSMDAASTAKTVSKDKPSPQSNKKTKTVTTGNPGPQSDKKPLQLGPKTVTRGSTCTEAQNKESPKATAAVTECYSRDVKDTALMTQKSSRGKSTPPKTRKRKRG